MKRIFQVFLLVGLLVISAISISGCSKDSLEVEQAVEKKVEKIAHQLVEEKFKTSPDNIAVMDYEVESLEKFCFVKLQDDMYVVHGGYQCSYGWSQENYILEILVEADFLIKQNTETNWSIKSIIPEKIESNAEKKESVSSIDDSSLVPFITAKEVQDGQLEIPNIVQKLIGNLMTELSNYKRERTTFMLVEASSTVSGLTQIDIPKDRNDIKACWEIKEGLTGIYLGYIEGLGYASPMLQIDFGSTSVNLNQKPLYLVKKADGYYLETKSVFDGEVKARVFQNQN